MVKTRAIQTDKHSGASKSKRYAVVVGINDYTGTSLNNLSFCAADAEAFYDALLTYCEYDPACVNLFSDGSHKNTREPNRSDILLAIADMARGATKDDSILFFFAGHGARDVQDSYLVTQEFRSTVMPDTSISMNMINRYMHDSKARFTMRFFDACHSGRIGARAVVSEPDIQRHFLVKAEGWATLSACKQDQSAYEDETLGHGIFSYCLIKGLSGDAATSSGEVTINSLSMYTIDKTIDITNDLGLPQTPVYNGSHAGTQVLATVRSTCPDQLPTALIKVQETTIEQLRPTPEKIPQFVQNIRSMLQNDPLPVEYIANSQEEKLTIGASLVQKVHGWCQEQESQYREQLQDVVNVTITHQSIQKCPCNLELAKYIEASKIKQAVDLRLTYTTERVKSNLWPIASVFDYQTREVLSGIAEQQGYYESAVVLTIRPQALLMPVCAMVIAIIPTSFGLYLLRYSCSTGLAQGQKEYWNPDTFTIRTLHALPCTDKEGVHILEELQDLYPQLVSFFMESCSARRVYLQNIGVSGQSLL